MGKVLSAYGGFTAQQIKDRSELPLQPYMAVAGTLVDCTHIPTTDIRNTLGAGSTAVGVLCINGNVNQWSNFSSREWVLSVGYAIVNQIKTPYTMGSFMGYNHGATAPVPFNATFVYNKGAVGSTITQSIAVKVKMGEYDWGKLGGTHAKVIIYDGASVFATSGILPINGAGNFLTFDNVSFSFQTGTVGTTTYLTKVFICASDGSEIAELPITGEVSCEIVAGITYSLTVKVSSNVKTFVMYGDADISNANYVTRSGTYSGNGTVAYKTLTSIVYTLRNQTTNVIEETTTISSGFNVYEFPTELNDMQVDDVELFSVARSRFTAPTVSQYVVIIMNYD